HTSVFPHDLHSSPTRRSSDLGELRRITAEVDWDRELGAIARRVLEKKGPALLFERIKGYETGRCTKVFVSGLGSVGRLALALGLDRKSTRLNSSHDQSSYAVF